MSDAIEGRWPQTDALVMAAAVADYRPARVMKQKMSKTSGALTLELERTEDILATASTRPGRSDRMLVGFAAETHDLEAHARAKLERKDLDWIVANDVSVEGIGFGTGDNAGLILDRAGATLKIPRCSKRAFAQQIVEHLLGDLQGLLNSREDSP